MISAFALKPAVSLLTSILATALGGTTLVADSWPQQGAGAQAAGFSAAGIVELDATL